MFRNSHSLEQFKGICGRIELQSERGLQLKSQLEVDCPCSLRFKVVGDKYSTLWVDIFPAYDEDRPTPSNQFEVSFDLHKDIYKIDINPHAISDDYIIISSFIHHIERIMRSIA